MKNKWIKDIVIGLIETVGTNDIHTLCDHFNISILRITSNISTDSYFIRNEVGDEFIFIRNNLDLKEERYLLAHELGHAILHTNLDVTYYCMKSCNKDKLEMQADTFASELLLSDINFNDYIIEDSTIGSISEEIDVAAYLIELKLDRSC